jgi:hypothetical protein
MPADEKPRDRPRPWLLAALGVAIVGLLLYWTWPSASPTPPPSNQSRDARAKPPAGQKASGPLEVRLEKLKESPPEPSDVERNPFRFQPRAAPPPSGFKPPSTSPGPNSGLQPVTPPPQPTGPPPIPLKFFAVIDAPGGKIAGLTDGRGVYKGREGSTIEGRYRIVKIGVESIVMEYLDGSGRQTIPLRGQ